MKTVLICMLQLHKSSGSARTAFENIRYFKSRGYAVHVAAMTLDKPSLEAEGVHTHQMLPWFKGTGPLRRKWYDWQIQRLRKKLSPTITLGHGDIQEQDVLTLHNCVFLASELIHDKPLDPNHEMAKIHQPILKNQTFKKMIANSELMKRDTVQRFKVQPEKIHVVYPALETNIFRPVTNSEKQNLRTRFGFTDKIVIALVTSGNFKKRGLDLFIQSIEALPQEVKAQIDVRVVGKDSQGEYKKTFLTFDSGLDDIQSYYQAIDIFVLPARIEEFGRVVLEAMGCGLPVVTTTQVGASELIEGEARQFIVPAKDVAALTNALATLIQNADLRLAIGALNAAAALKHSEAVLYPKFDSVFLDI